MTEPVNEWREAVLDASVLCHLGWGNKTPKQIIDDVISWHCMVALDPAVSNEAQALIDQGRAIEREYFNQLEKSQQAIDLIARNAVK